MSDKSELKINSKFASKYEKYRQREELQRLKDRYGAQGDESDSGSESESDEDSEVELDPQQDKDFYRTLSLLKKKDPKIYQTDTQFYTEPAADSGGTIKPSSSQKAQKPMFLKDYERKVILERGGKYDDEEDEEESDDEEAVKRRERAESPSYIQEQKDLRESFSRWVQDSDEEGSGGEEPLLTRRNRTQEEKDREEQDYVEWLKGQAELEGPEELQDLSYLKEYWNNPQLDEKERFLRDFVLNKAYLEQDPTRIPSYDEVVQEEVQDSSEEGEDFLLKQEVFERHYNFRFEEPDSQKIKTYPRSIATSVRCSDERRREARSARRDRKQREREQKQQQLQHMKNLKRDEILQRLQRLKQLTGQQEDDGFSVSHLEGDFSPEQHDIMMQEMFGDQYYGEEEEEKPQFDDDEQEDHWNWDTWTGEEGGGGEEEEEEGEEGEEEGEVAVEEPNCEDPDFIMDADYDPSQPSSSKKKRKRRKDDAPLMGKRRRKSHFAEVITKEKPVFDPEEKSFQQYLDEFYKLDYEDIIDDLPCRFRYRQVLPNNFGLTTDEILGSDEKDLNRWCSLKKTCMFRSDKEEWCDLKNYQIKAQNVKKKQEVLSSFYSEEGAVEEGKNTGKKRRDRLKKPEEEAGLKQDPEEGLQEGPQEGPQEGLQEGPQEGPVTQTHAAQEEDDFLVPKKSREEERTPVEQKKTDESGSQAEGPRKRPFRHPRGRLIQRPFRVKMGGREFSGQRLKAYGLNPKRLHFRQKGRQRNKDQRKSQD